MALTDTQALAATLSLGGTWRNDVRQAEGAFKGLDRAAAGSQRGFTSTAAGFARTLQGIDKATRNTQRSLQTFGRNIERGVKVGLLGVATAGIAVLKVAGDFEAQLRTINTVARLSADGLKAVGEGIRGLARDTGTPLEELTQGYYDLVSAGIKAKDAQNVLTAANRLAIGGLASTAETVDLLTTAINTYGGDATKAAGYADIFAKAVERGKVTAAEIAASFSQVGPIAAASGIEIQELGAAYARLTAAGVPAAEAATDVRSAIVALTRRTSDLKNLEKQTGKNYLSIAGKQGLVVALQQLRTDGQKAGIPLIDLLGRVEGLNFTLLTTGSNFDDYNADLRAMGQASGTAAAQMAERQQGLNYQLNRLKALAKDAGITIGTALIPKLVPLVERLNAFISANQGKIAQFGTDLAGGFEKFASAVQKVDWQPFINGLQISASVAEKAIGLFMSLPPEVRSIAVAGLAINKVTGGLGSSIIKDLAGLALRSLTTINAAQVTVIGANVTGGGLPGAAAGGGGKLAAARQFLGIVGISFIAAEAAQTLGDTINTQIEQFNQQNPQQPISGRFDPAAINPFNVPAVVNNLRLAAEALGFGRRNLPTVTDTRSESLGIAKASRDQTIAQRQLTEATKDQDQSVRASKAALDSYRKAMHRGISDLAQAHKDFRAAEKARGSQLRLSFAGSGKAGSLAEVRYLAREFDKSQKPFYRSQQNANRYLSYLQGAERTFLARGDTHSARTVHNAITTMRRVLAGKADATKTATAHGADKVAGAIRAKKLSVAVNNTIQTTVTTSIRDTIKTQTTYRRYGNVLS